MNPTLGWFWPTALTTASMGYVRLHGRNYRNWFSPAANVRDRYDHLDSPGTNWSRELRG
jgi:hypothetical protein